MLSLGNTYSPAELEEFDKRVGRGLDGEPYEYFCELKFDGVSISLLYENSRFSKGVGPRTYMRALLNLANFSSTM